MIQDFLNMAQTDPKLFVTVMALANITLLALAVTIKNVKESLTDLKNRR